MAVNGPAVEVEGAVVSSEVIACAGCGTKNRVPNAAAGRPRCSRCHADLPWVANITGAEFGAAIAGSAMPVLVDLWAPWCGPCRAVAPALEAIAAEQAGHLRVMKVNVDQAPDVSAQLGVQGIPTMLLFNNGAEVARQVGALPADAIRRWLDDALTG